MKHHRLLFSLIIIIILIIPSCKEKKVLKIKAEKTEKQTRVIHQQLPELKRGKRGGSMIRADISEIDTLNIVTTRSPSLYEVLKLVFEGLLSINPYTGEITGGIAKNYQIENQGFTIIVKLNDDVYFSDGKRCTADDVLFTFEKIYLNPDVNSKKIDLLTIRNNTVKITKIDDVTVKFDLPVPYRPFLYNLCHLEILPKHIIEPKIEKYGISWFNNKWGKDFTTIKEVIGTGPYMIEKFDRGKLIKLTRNPYYKNREGGLYLENMPYLDEVIELLNLDADTRLLKFQIGEIDFYSILDTDFENGNFESLIKNNNQGNYTLYYYGETLRNSHFLSFNQNPAAVPKEKLKLFRDKRFRKAVSMCINREKISKVLYNSYSTGELSPLRDISFFYKSMGSNPYDTDTAKSLFLSLGLKDDNNDGILELPSGKPFHLTIITNEDNPFRIKMAEIIVEGLKKAGIDAEIKSISYDLLITKILDSFDWECTILGASGSIEPNDLAWIWESRGPLHLWYPYQNSPSTPWEKRIDELFSMGRTTWDFTLAKKYYEEFQNIAAEELPIINIVTPYQIYAYRNGYGNIFSSAVTYNSIGIIPYLYQE